MPDAKPESDPPKGSDIRIVTEFPRKVREIENTWIELPDGTKLAARIWLPEDAEADPVPAILEYLPYRKRDGTVERDHLTHPYFAGHGYAGVRVDMRGTGDSEGVCKGEYLLQEQDDCLAVIDWLTAQPWCSGKVGMMGISWGGFNGLQVAARQPEALGAVITLCSTDDRYADDIHFMGGCVLTDKLTWGATAFGIAHTPPDPAIVGDRWREMWRERLEGNGLWLLDWFRHQRRDAFYTHGSICEDYSAVEVPVFAIGGWMDGYTNTVFRLLDNLPGPKKGLIGPWAHKYPHFAKPGPRIGFLQEALRWWDQHLKGIDTGVMDEPLLRAYIQDPHTPDPAHHDRAGRWVGNAMTSRATDAVDLHVTAKGLSGTAEAEVQTITLASPQNAGHSAQSWVAYGIEPDGPTDQAGEAGLMRIFDSAQLSDDLDLLGFPMLTARVASDVTQANIAATLSAVSEDGRATLVSFGVLNLTHRDSHTDPAPLVPGEEVAISVQLNACGQKIAAGQRLRLALSTAYWPLIWPSQSAATLSLSDARLSLPVRPKHDSDAALAALPPPEGAEPLASEALEPGSYERKRQIDYVTGRETYARISDSGLARHLHTGLCVRDLNSDVFSIHPDDPNSASGTCRWVKSYARDDWRAEIDVEVTVEALADTWRISARLLASDQDGTVADKTWAEDIPRDLV